MHGISTVGTAVATSDTSMLDAGQAPTPNTMSHTMLVHWPGTRVPVFPLAAATTLPLASTKLQLARLTSAPNVSWKLTFWLDWPLLQMVRMNALLRVPGAAPAGSNRWSSVRLPSISMAGAKSSTWQLTFSGTTCTAALAEQTAVEARQA